LNDLITKKSLANSEASIRILDTHSVKICVLKNTKKNLKHHDIACLHIVTIPKYKYMLEAHVGKPDGKC